MTTFGKHLGELAGHDIVLWREAGLDPRVIDGDQGEGLHGLAQRAAGWVGLMCRHMAFLVNACVRPSAFSDLALRAAHVRTHAPHADNG